MTFVRHALALVGELVAYGARSGRWWVPIVVVALAVAAAVTVTAKVVVPTTVYVLF